MTTNDIQKEKLCAAIKTLRASTGLSQSQFAQKYSLATATLQQWEMGRRKPPESIIFLIHRVIYLEDGIDVALDLDFQKK